MEHLTNHAGWQMPDKLRRDSVPPAQGIASGTELTVTALAEIVGLVERKLAWFGLQSVRTGPYVTIRNGAILIDLLDGDKPFCRIELNRHSGAIAFPSGNALRPLMTSLRKAVNRKAVNRNAQ